MKTKLFFSLIISGCFNYLSFSQTNKYHHFPNTNAVWNTYYAKQGYDCAKSTFTIEGDTIIKSLTYHKLHVISIAYACFYQTNNPDLSKPYSSNAGYAGAYREDTLLRKVFYIPYKDSTELLLFDFSLKVGDTIKSYHFQPDFRFVVSSIDSVLINNEYHRRWNKLPYSQIEGIGCSLGLLFTFNFEATHRLECFSLNNITLYPKFSSTGGCKIINSINTPKFESQAFLIEPNPSNGVFKIKTVEKQFSVEIYDVTGQLIYKEFDNTEINLSKYKKGLYFIKFQNNNGIYSKKILLN